MRTSYPSCTSRFNTDVCPINPASCVFPISFFSPFDYYSPSCTGMQLLSIPNKKPSDASIICKYNFLRSRIQGDGQIKTTVETLEAV
jgi:hypothetical protein